jgi:predicted DsbA family dithiol-disulfide isomerase
LEKLENSHGVAVQWRSFELRPAGAPPMPPEYRARIEQGQPRLNAIAREQYGLELNRGPLGIDSRAALRGAKLADQAGRGREYHNAVFRAYWVDGHDISDVARLVAIAAGVGLDAEAFQAALADPVTDAAVQADVDLARELGINAVPAMVFDEKYLVSGAQPYAVLVELTDRVRALREGQST